MRNSLIIALIMMALPQMIYAQAVLIEEVEVRDPQATTRNPAEERRSADKNLTAPTPSTQRSATRSYYGTTEFTSAHDMRSKRPAGVGLMAAGASGSLGALLEFNLTQSEPVLLSVGGGSGFRALHTQYRYILGGTYLSPYAGIGYARWFNQSETSEGVRETNPAARFISQDQMESGRFILDLITPTLGLQYNQLTGEYSGLGAFLEVSLLTQIPQVKAVPAGAVGMFYYF